MIRARRPVSFVGALLIVAALLPVAATPVAAAGATVPAGFADETVWSDLDHPMAIAFAPDGKIFVAEKRGTINVFDSFADQTPTVFADLSVNVGNYWDRGMMGLAIDPAYSTGNPYVYVLYAYNHILGDSAAAPRWPTSGVNPWNEICPSPPSGTTDGCVMSGRLSRLRSNLAANPVMTGAEDVLIEDWCQQFPSHSQGTLMFGPEGALYVSSGDGASFNGGSPDYGQLGGTLSNTPTPRNPCGDPPGGVGGSMSPPSAEGGALRSQDIRTSGDPTGLDGTILRLDPDTGDAWPTNANIGSGDPNNRRIIAYGLRNPFRFTIKPGTDDVWLGDVGFGTWEEINRLTDPNASPLNFGWPCYEGAGVHAFFDNLGLALCDSLSAAAVTSPYYAYNHSSEVVSGDSCGTGSSSISGLAFLPASSPYPASYRNGLFFTDYSRGCIWFMPADGSGNPTVSGRVRFANLDRADPDTDGGAVSLTIAPTGDLMYADYDRGEVRRIHYYGGNVPPVASFTATPSFGPAPLSVSFNASGSTDANGGALTYAWDLDGDGQYDDATGVTTSRTYGTVGDVEVGLKVTDTDGAFGTTTRTVSAGNSPPTVSISTPASSLTWTVGQAVGFSATASDAQDGTLPASAFEWTLSMEHCPSDCHSHIITNVSGVKSGTFDAPDHEYPSHIKLSLTVTDSDGLTASDEVEIFPKTGTVAATSDPTGIPLTVSATTAIVGSSISVSAPATAVLGEDTWAFSSWSDGGARTHGVPVIQGAKNLVAHYTLSGSTDRSDTCSGSPAAVAPSNLWISGTFAKSNDADWYRFKLTKAGKIRLVLGDLTTGGRMDLYSGCTTLLQTSDRGGNGSEEIIRSLAAGTYAVKLTGSGTEDTLPYVIRQRALPASVHILSSRVRIEGGTLRLIGELYNNTTKTVGSTKVTAKLYNASNVLLATRTAYADLSYMVPNSKAPFRIVGTLPAGYHHAVYTISATPTTRLVGAPSVTATTNGQNGSGQYVVAGTAKNPYTKSVTTLWVAVSLYDGRANILDAARAKVGTTTLGALKSTTFSATFVPLGLTPDKTYIRGMVFR